MQVVPQHIFLSGLADELGRDRDQFVPTANVIADLGLDELELFEVMIFLERMTPTGDTSEIEWEHMTLGDLYRHYVLTTLEHDVLKR